MPVKHRLQIIAVVCFGGSAVLVCALRIIVVLEFIAEPDNTTYVLAKLVIMTCIELQVAIITANMPAVKAMWTLWRTGKLQKPSSRPSLPFTLAADFPREDLQLDRFETILDMENGQRSRRKPHSEDESQSQRYLTSSRSIEGLDDRLTEDGTRREIDP